MRAKLQECRSRSAKIMILSAVFLLAAFTFAGMAEARSFMVYNNSLPSQAYFIVNGTTGYAGVGLMNPAYPLDVSGAGRFSGNLYLGTAGRYVYDTGSIIGVSSGLLLGGNLDLGGNSIVSGAWLNATSINATGIYGATLYEGGTALSSKYALQSTSISSGSGLSGGGDLSATRTLSIANGGVTNIMIAAGTVNKTQISGILDSTVVGSLYGENITQGTIDSARISGVYSGITGLGIQAQNLDMGGNNLTNYNYIVANESAKLNGQLSSYYLDTSSTAQTKSGSLTVTGAWLNATNLNVSSNGYFGGNVGIGASSSSSLLSLYKTGSNTLFNASNGTVNSGLFLGTLSGGNAGASIGTNSNHQFRLFANGADALTVDTNGYVGIGTTNPGDKLQVENTGGAVAVSVKAAATTSPFFDLYNGANYWRMFQGGSVSGSANKLHWSYNSNTPLVTIDTDGNVGIGTASPGTKLDVTGGSGNPLDDPAYAGYLVARFGNTGANNQAFIQVNASGSDTAGIVFKTTSNPGTDGWGVIAYGNMLRIANDTGITNIKVGSPLKGITVMGDGKVGIGRQAGTYALEVQGDAGKTSGGTAWQSISDAKFKNVSGGIENALGIIDKLKPIKYTWNDLYRQKYGVVAGKEMYGFTAQNVKEVIPEFVTADKEGYLWYNPSGYEAVLTKAVQEQQSQIQNLTAQNAEQQKEIGALNARLSALESGK